MVSILVRGAGGNRVCLLPKEAGCVELVELLKLILELLGHFGCLQAQAHSLYSRKQPPDYIMLSAAMQKVKGSEALSNEICVCSCVQAAD